MPIGDHNLALAALQAVVLYAPLLAGPGRAVAFRVDGRPRRSRFTHFLLACWWSSAAQSGQFICCVRACVRVFGRGGENKSFLGQPVVSTSRWLQGG
jgi:hypothetical protein